MAGLRRDAERIATRFDLRYRALEAERVGTNGHYGICYSDGTIRIRLQHATSGRPLKYSSLVNTLCHELAHLRHFDHGLRFQRLYAQLLEFARDEGIYRPGRVAVATEVVVATEVAVAAPEPEGPRQLSLFATLGG